MTYTRGVGDSSPQPGNLRESNAASAIPGLPPAEASRHNAATQPNPLDQIAADSANLALANALLSQTSASSDVRVEKIAALRHAIESGTYAVTSADVAAKMIEELQK